MAKARYGNGLYRTNTSWRVDFWYKGQRHLHTIGPIAKITVSQAKADAARYRGKIIAGELNLTGRQRGPVFSQAAQDYIDHVEAHGKGVTVDRFKGLKRILERHMGNHTLSGITPWLLQKYQQQRLKEPAPNASKGGRVAINRELNFVRQVFNHAIKAGRYTGDNPATRQKVRRYDEPHDERYMKPEEAARLLAVSPEPWRTVWLCGIYAGLRLDAEALTLTWNHVDFDRNTLTVASAHSKTNKPRTVPLHPMLKAALEGLPRNGPFVFCKPDGKRYAKVRPAFDRYKKRAELPPEVKPHVAGRHTFASWLAQKGASDRLLMELGGWESPAMLKRYAKLRDEEQQKAVSELPHIFPQQQESKSKKKRRK